MSNMNDYYSKSKKNSILVVFSLLIHLSFSSLSIATHSQCLLGLSAIL